MGRLPVVLVLVVLGCGRVAPPAADRALQTQGSWRAQVAAVRAGRTSRIEVDRPPGPEEWESLRGLPGLRELVLRAGVVDDSRAGLLATLPDIERLVLRASPLSDAGLRALAAATSLRDLNVPQADCTAAGIRALARLGNLRSLRLGGVRAPGADVGDALATLVGLRSLHLIDVPLGDTGLEGIARLPGLGSLYLDGAGVSDGAWARYCDAHPGVHVHVDQAHHDRDPRRGHDRDPRLPPAGRSGHASEETR